MSDNLTHTGPPLHYEPVSAVALEVPLRRDLTEPLPPTPSDLPIGRFLPTIGDVIALLPAALAAAFRHEIDRTPFQDLPNLVMEWCHAAISLHSDDVQRSLEMIEDGDEQGLKTMFQPLPV